MHKISQYYSTAEVGKDLCRSSSPTPCSKQTAWGLFTVMFELSPRMNTGVTGAESTYSVPETLSGTIKIGCSLWFRVQGKM